MRVPGGEFSDDVARAVSTSMIVPDGIVTGGGAGAFGSTSTNRRRTVGGHLHRSDYRVGHSTSLQVAEHWGKDVEVAMGSKNVRDDHTVVNSVFDHSNHVAVSHQSQRDRGGGFRLSEGPDRR